MYVNIYGKSMHIVQNLKQPECLLTGECIKPWYTHTFKMNELLIHATT